MLRRMADSKDEELLFELLAELGWQGGADVIILMRNLSDRDPIGFGRFIRDILLQGYDPEQQTRKAEKDNDGDKQEAAPDWKLLLSEYCRAYPGKDAFDVYDQTPFPFFMEMLPEARREKARRHIYHALEAGAGFGGGKKVMEAWQRQAGYTTDTEEKADKYSEDMTPEQIESERRKLNERMG